MIDLKPKTQFVVAENRKPRLLLTGGGGFLGSHLAKRLTDYELTIPRSATCDLRVWENCLEATRGQDIVIHAAAQVGGIGANREHPAEFFYNNILMGVLLLHAAWLNGVKKFVSVGTICEYPQFCPTPFLEENLWEGFPEPTNSAYAIAKKAILVQAQAYRAQYGFNAIHVMPVNMYGIGDNFSDDSSHVVPALIKKCVTAVRNGDKEIVVWGTGKATREFLWVEDGARGIHLAMEHYDQPEPINIGSSDEISIFSLVEMIARLTGFTGKVVWDASKPDGQPRRKLDTTKAQREFGFKSETRLEDGLRATIDWYLKQ